MSSCARYKRYQGGLHSRAAMKAAAKQKMPPPSRTLRTQPGCWVPQAGPRSRAPFFVSQKHPVLKIQKYFLCGGGRWATSSWRVAKMEGPVPGRISCCHGAEQATRSVSSWSWGRICCLALRKSAMAIEAALDTAPGKERQWEPPYHATPLVNGPEGTLGAWRMGERGESMGPYLFCLLSPR